jgi:hypothetical protein
MADPLLLCTASLVSKPERFSYSAMSIALSYSSRYKNLPRTYGHSESSRKRTFVRCFKQGLSGIDDMPRG